ncbi:phospholipase [Legionella antarctica]|uniref:Phospholipase n=1 Tax=Legionella antarctica TaxID=2708020 RepID=A0A6F8T9H1_9GAMM|nr:SGNH/GDSL hydrolase family protein [Legionella antarctica]BCA96998.1 phospholipase [Legionella antarctica]
MLNYKRMCLFLCLILLIIPLSSFASTSVKSMVVFGDSLSDTGNTTRLLRSLRQQENPAFIVAPFKVFVLNKMIDFANDYYVPQMVLDAGINVVTNFFDNELAPYIANLVGKIKRVPILPGAPYWNSRFSNGRVWNEYLAQMWAIQKSDEDVYINVAFGGGWAATYDYQLTVWNLIRHPLGTIKTLIIGKLIPPSLGFTVQGYLLEHTQLDSETVYFVFSGSNDYLNVLLFEDNYNTTIMSNYVDNVLENLTAAVLKLEQAGAKRFVIMGVPHIGETPKFVKTTDRQVLNDAVDQHNQRLAIRMDEWQKQYPKADFLFIDTERYLAKALNNPEQYGFSNISEACIDVKFPMLGALAHTPFARNYVLTYAHLLQYRDPQFLVGESNYHLCDFPQDYLFWDEIHPTTRAHNYLAFEICTAMKDHGYSVNCEAPDSSS